MQKQKDYEEVQGIWNYICKPATLQRNVQTVHSFRFQFRRYALLFPQKLFFQIFTAEKHSNIDKIQDSVFYRMYFGILDTT